MFHSSHLIHLQIKPARLFTTTPRATVLVWPTPQGLPLPCSLQTTKFPVPDHHSGSKPVAGWWAVVVLTPTCWLCWYSSFGRCSRKPHRPDPEVDYLACEKPYNQDIACQLVWVWHCWSKAWELLRFSFLVSELVFILLDLAVLSMAPNWEYCVVCLLKTEPNMEIRWGFSERYVWLLGYVFINIHSHLALFFLGGWSPFVCVPASIWVYSQSFSWSTSNSAMTLGHIWTLGAGSSPRTGGSQARCWWGIYLGPSLLLMATVSWAKGPWILWQATPPVSKGSG